MKNLVIGIIQEISNGYILTIERKANTDEEKKLHVYVQNVAELGKAFEAQKKKFIEEYPADTEEEGMFKHFFKK